MDTAEVALVRSSFEAALRASPGRALLAVLAESGWAELTEAEPAVAVAELFEAAGRLLVSAPVLDLTVADALGVCLAPGTAVVHPTLEAWDTPPGLERGNGEIAVDGFVLSGLPDGTTLVVPLLGVEGGFRTVEVAAARLERVKVSGFDESLGLVRVVGSVAGAGGGDGAAGWESATRAARRALGHELVGVAQEALDVAARHVTDRVQFGKPIAAFQTVRHRMTEVYVAIASARAALEAAWVTDEPVAADAAKALAGRAAELAGKHCLQVTGAIGFTWEYELHRRIRRARLLDGFYGSTRSLSTRIGAALLSDQRVPRVRSLP